LHETERRERMNTNTNTNAGRNVSGPPGRRIGLASLLGILTLTTSTLAVGGCAIEDDAIEDDAIEDDAIEDEAIEDDAIGDEVIGDEAIGDEAIGDEAVRGEGTGSASQALTTGRWTVVSTRSFSAYCGTSGPGLNSTCSPIGAKAQRRYTWTNYSSITNWYHVCAIVDLVCK
jgi:hypothetical protein